MKLPSDPVILLSFLNTMLRDKYDSLDELCSDFEADKFFLLEKLKAFGYKYDEKQNQFK